MTKLEQKIFDALLRYEGVTDNPMTASICKGHAQVAAKIALELAREAYHEGWSRGWDWGKEGKDTGTFKQFIQDYE